MRLAYRTIPHLVAIALLLTAGPAVTIAGQGRSPATPDASPVAAGPAWQVTDQQPIGNVPLVALAPDGGHIAGTNPDGQFCVVDIAAMEEICDAETLPIHLESIVWAPDSSAVAYSLDAFRFAYESDIYLFELETGRSVNLTDDGLEGGMLDLEAGSVPVDVLPTWAPDSQSLTFARTDWATEQRGTELLTIARGGGEPEPRHVVSRDVPFAIYTPMHSPADGSLLYAISLPAPDAHQTGLWLLDGADASQVMPGSRDDAYPMPAIADVAEMPEGTVVSGYSLTAISQSNTDKPFSFLLDLESSETTPLAHPEDEGVMLGPAAFAPDGSTLVATSLISEEDQVVILGAQDQVISLGPSPEGAAGASITFVPPQWAANGTILLAGFTATPWLLTVAPGSGSTPEAPCSCTPPPEG